MTGREVGRVDWDPHERLMHLVSCFSRPRRLPACRGNLSASALRSDVTSLQRESVMHQVERRRCEELTPSELALLKTCGGEIRRSDHRARELARSRAPTEHGAVQGYGPRVMSVLRDWKLPAVFKVVIGRTWALIKADAAQFRRRPGHQ